MQRNLQLKITAALLGRHPLPLKRAEIANVIAAKSNDISKTLTSLLKQGIIEENEGGGLFLTSKGKKHILNELRELNLLTKGGKLNDSTRIS